MSVTVLPTRPAQITYDSQHTVTLSVSDWLSLKTDLFFAAFNADERGAPDTANRIRALSARLGLQVDAALDAAEAHDAEESKAECDCCGNRAELMRCWPHGMETFACDECRGAA